MFQKGKIGRTYPNTIPEDKARDGPNSRFNFVQREMTHGGSTKKKKKTERKKKN
ncbi:hypothetical protein RND71_029576 [Anisodus tanguticus]|uniref:Uncharacterized protein n=1 Tax=Anisodus tanguticus TaxID=243964 RepID=A0AAE1RET0_9SOLA|nr:hypothetical protein RND71_029576 [Anisodus tanguticus]